MVAHAGGGVLLAVVAVAQEHGLGSSLIQEVVKGSITVIAGTLAHVGVVRHLILIAETGHDLVVAHEIGEVVLRGEHAVVYGVVPGEQLIAG